MLCECRDTCVYGERDLSDLILTAPPFGMHLVATLTTAPSAHRYSLAMVLCTVSYVCVCVCVCTPGPLLFRLSCVGFSEVQAEHVMSVVRDVLRTSLDMSLKSCPTKADMVRVHLGVPPSIVQ